MKRRAFLFVLLSLIATTVVRSRDNPHYATSLPTKAVAVLEEAEQMTLFSLDPWTFQERPADAPLFHGQVILGEVVISKPEQCRQVSDELKRAVNASDGTMHMCFVPRHGLRVTRVGVTYDFVICYECGRVDTWLGEKRVEATGLTGKPDVFNAILRAANIPLPPTLEEAMKQAREPKKPTGR
jgi:hypothetical protein